MLTSNSLEATAPLRRFDPKNLHRVYPRVLVGLFLVLWTMAVVAAQASGRVPTDRAVILLLAPVVGVSAAFRPAWLVLLFAAVPPALVAHVPSLGLVLVLMVALGAHLVIRGRLSLGVSSGMVPVLVLVLVAHLFTAEVTGEAALVARGFLNLFTYLVLLGLLTYNTTATGDLDVRHLANALLLGSAVTLILERTGLAVSQLADQAGNTAITSVGRNAAYVAVMGFGLAFARLLLPDPDMPSHHRVFYAVLAALFAVVTGLELVRAALLSGLVVVLLVAIWAQKRRYWGVIALAAVMLVTIPVARERIVPDYRAGVAQSITSTRFTSGRWGLWTILWKEAAAALPAGHGYGFTFTLSPERVFGFETFVNEGSKDAFVYPHNDYLFWALELGLLGFAALAMFWVHLIRTFRRLSREGPYRARHGAYVLSGILVTTFIVQLVDNSFAIRAVGAPFFIAAGAVFGLATSVRNVRARHAA